MNIFYINPDPIQAARELADDHIRKMQIESAQMLSVAHWETGAQSGTPLYKPSHKNHPSTKWVRESIQHYRWLVKHGLEICEEFKLRYGKDHKTKQVLEWLRDNEPPLPDNGFKEPPCCMPEDYILQEGVVPSYKNFYIKDKVGVKGLGWNKIPSKKPNWV